MTRVSGLRCHLQRHGVVLVWLPVLLLFPLLNLSGEALVAAGQVVLVLALATAAVGSRGHRPGRGSAARPRRPDRARRDSGRGLADGLGRAGHRLPAVLRGWRLLVAIVAATVGVAVSIAVIEGIGDAYLLSVGGVFLSGVTTTSFLRLVEAVEQLRRTREELAQAAVAEERARMSRDLHDLLGHTSERDGRQGRGRTPPGGS